MAIDGLPVMHDLAWVFAHQIRFDFFDRFGTGQGSTFKDRFPEPGDAGVRVYFQKQPARFHQKGF